MENRDNWGSIARFGMFIVGSEVVPEAEWWAMLPEGTSVHAARVTATTPWAAWTADRTRVVLAADLERGAQQFAGMRPAAVVVGHTSSSVLGGAGWDDAVVSALTPLLPGSHVTTNGLDSAAALCALGLERPFVVLPPWFGDAFAEKALAYLRERGFAPPGYLIHRPDAKWNGCRPDELYRKFMHIDQRIDLLFEQIVASCPSTADGVFIGGTGFRCVGVIRALEDRLQRPVVTANQASLWHAMRLAGCQTRIEGYGALLAGAP
ncbi:MAG: hypothetical protein JSS20_11685 [Proteobacteria bacterium]|nr:hypothetical protein [Pseudomonadota bacterium]